MCGRSLDNLIEKFPQLDFCCCGCRLSTGVKILGWMGVFYGVVIEIVLLAACVQVNIQTRNDPKTTDSDNEAVLIATVIGGSVATLFIVLITLLSVMLLIGVYKNDVMKVRCWLRVNVFFFALGLFFAALGLITVLFTNPVAIIGQLIVLFINFGISFYFISVVKSHYTEQMAAFERVTNS